MRRVLVISYFFPPVGGVGVQRTLKFTKYLPGHGWQPTVLAPREPAYPLRDRSLLEQVPPEVTVHRTLSLEPGRLVGWASRQVMARRVAGSPPGTDVPSLDETPPAVIADGAGRRLLRRAAGTWHRAWHALLFPDEAIAWLPSAVVVGAITTRRAKADALYSSSPPISTHVIAGILKGLTGRPWVADFRDPWIGNAFMDDSGPGTLGRRLRLERWIVDRADRVVLAVEPLRADFAARYPDRADIFVTIPNGYDRADLAGLSPARHDPRHFVLLYAGSLYRSGELEVFLRGLAILLARRPDLGDRLRVDFVGRVNEGNARIAAAFQATGGLGEVVRFEGFVPRSEALARMAGADALLQLMPNEPGAGMFVGGKLLEYLALDRPILAVMPPGEGSTIVEGLPGGRTADVEPESIARALERLVDDPPAAAPNDPDGRYDRVVHAARLAAILDEIVDGAPARGRQSARPERT